MHSVIFEEVGVIQYFEKINGEIKRWLMPITLR